MPRLMQLAFALCLFWGMSAQAQDPVKHVESRGELLYSISCNACHTSQVHWREHKVAKDWSSLMAQVRRWQESISLGWKEDEITDVARYLNAVYYHFSNTDQKDTPQDKKPSRSLQEY